MTMEPFSGVVKRLPSGKFQITASNNREFPAFLPAQVPEALAEKLSSSKQPIPVFFEVHQGTLAYDSSGKVRVWLPGQAPPTAPTEATAARPPLATPPPEPGKEQALGRDHKGWPHKGGGGHSRPEPGRRYTIQRVERLESGDKLLIHYDPKTDDERTAKQNERFQATDPALAFQKDNQFVPARRGENPNFRISKFGAGIPGLTSKEPSVHRSPYNFVEFAADSPWDYGPEHPDHSRWAEETFSGVIAYKARALTPVFVPEGFPFAPKTENESDQLREVPRYFCRMKRIGGEAHYAIPGASVKGVIRSSVEALSNSRMGVVNEESYNKPIPYRRRCFNMREEIHVGKVIAGNEDGSYTVQKVREGYVRKGDGNDPPKGAWQIVTQERKPIAMDAAGPYPPSVPIPYRSGLLNWPDDRKSYAFRMIADERDRLTISHGVAGQYHANLEHPHFVRHYKEFMEKGNSPPGKPQYARPGGTCPPPDTVLDQLKLKVGDIIYFTTDRSNPKLIDSFGKNVNYLWPAAHSVKDLAGRYFTPDRLSLHGPLCMAERMFGFSGKHEKNAYGSPESHPYRGKLRFETLWGPEEDKNEEVWSDDAPREGCKGVKLRLAPLTSPQTRAKARPLYLKPQSGTTSASQPKLSASYSDRNPKMRGRKFYWHQRFEGAGDNPSGIWPMHRRQPNHDTVASQLPPPILALKAGTELSGRIHFDNLAAEELGALLFALQGDGSYDHAVKMGKGKPRGLGSMRIQAAGMIFHDPRRRYASLDPSHEEPTIDGERLKTEIGDKIASFKTWCEEKATGDKNSKEVFEGLQHIRDFKKLHTFPEKDSVRYYPLNFGDYSWLPAVNVNPDEPQGPRPEAMCLAREDQGV